MGKSNPTIPHHLYDYIQVFLETFSLKLCFNNALGNVLSKLTVSG